MSGDLKTRGQARMMEAGLPQKRNGWQEKETSLKPVMSGERPLLTWCHGGFAPELVPRMEIWLAFRPATPPGSWAGPCGFRELGCREAGVPLLERKEGSASLGPRWACTVACGYGMGWPDRQHLIPGDFHEQLMMPRGAQVPG